MSGKQREWLYPEFAGAQGRMAFKITLFLKT
jgi:hypothetical protein